MDNNKDIIKKAITDIWDTLLTDDYRNAHQAELEYLVNEIASDANNIKQALKKLETIYISNAENLAILNIEKFKGEHDTNKYVLEGWLNDVYHLNLYQTIIAKILESMHSHPANTQSKKHA